LSRSVLVVSLENLLSALQPAFGAFAARLQNVSTKAPGGDSAGSPGVSFLDIAKQAGLNAKTVYGGEHKNKYLLETTGCGAAFYDYDNDGWPDIFLVNGWRLEGFPKGQEPHSHLF